MLITSNLFSAAHYFTLKKGWQSSTMSVVKLNDEGGEAQRWVWQLISNIEFQCR